MLFYIISTIFILAGLALVRWAVKRLLVAVPTYLTVMQSDRIKEEKKRQFAVQALPHIQLYYIVIFGVAALSAVIVYFIIHPYKFLHR